MREGSAIRIHKELLLDDAVVPHVITCQGSDQIVNVRSGCRNLVHVFGLRLDTLKRDYLLVLTPSPHRTSKFYTRLHSPESPHGYVEDDSYLLPGQ